MAKKSLARNYVYNLIYEILILILPIITTPYLSRILGAVGIGIYTYTYSIVTYFILFGSLGVAMYGQREIAYAQNNINSRKKIFFEIVIFRFIAIIFATIIYAIIFMRSGIYSLYYRILVFELIGAAFDISWFFQGIEEFDKTVVRNLIVKLLSLVLIFVVVKTPEDLWKYFAIYVGAELIGNASLWLYVPKYIQKISIKDIEIKKHFLPTVQLFIPQIAIQIYVVLDKTMIGQITGSMSEVGYYEQAQKIVKAALVVTSALQTVMASRIANAYSRKDDQSIKNYIIKTIKFILFLTIPMALGLVATASKFVPWYYGDNFDRAIPIIITSSPILIFIGLSGVTGIQYLVQIGKQKEFTISVVIGAVINTIINIVLISFFQSIGAAIASSIAEAVILLVQLHYVKEVLKIQDIIKNSIKCIIAGIVMFLIVKILVFYLSISIINTAIEVLVGIIIYLIVLKLLRYDLLEELIGMVNNYKQNKFKGEKA